VVGGGADHHTRGKTEQHESGPLCGLRVLPRPLPLPTLAVSMQ